MTNTAKTGTIVAIVAVLLLVGVVWYMRSPSSNQPISAYEQASTSPDTGLATSPSDTSNAAISSDISSIDAQMSAATTDSTNVDQSISNAQ